MKKLKRLLTPDPGCTRCALHKVAPEVCVLGEGPKKADVMVITDSPELSDASDELLVEVLNEYGIDTDKVYFASSVACQHPSGKAPTSAQMRECKYWLEKQIKLVKPKYVLLVGGAPCEQLLGLKGIRKLRGKPTEQDGIIYMPCYSPGYIIRDDKNRPSFEADIRLFSEIIEKGKIPVEEGLNYELVTDLGKFDLMLEDLKNSSCVSYDIETNGLYPWAEGAKITTIGFGTKKFQWILPIRHDQSPFSPSQIKRMVKKLKKAVDELFVVMHNGKFDMLWTRVHLDWKMECAFDTMMAHFILDENQRHGLKYLAQTYFGVMDWDLDLETKQGDGELTTLAKYHAHDLYYTRKLKFALAKQLSRDADVKRVFDLILTPCVNLFTDIEFDGVYIDTKKLAEVEQQLTTDIAEAQKELLTYGDINWGSPKQLAELLFNKMDLDIIERTKSGQPATSESVIKRLNHPVGEALLKWRAANKQLSAFVDGWKGYLDGNFLHPSFKLHGTVTGRLSCANPNLQQVPRDKKIRSLITAPPGYTMIEADLSQVELRVAAELAGEQQMIYAFTHGIDVHWLTGIREMARGGGLSDIVINTAKKLSKKKKLSYSKAIEILIECGHEASIEVNSEWKELRKKAKAINFGYLYGMWWKKFKDYARDNYGVTITDEEARQSREAFFEMYPGLVEWHNRQRRFAQRHGYVRSLSGRKRRLPKAMDHKDSMEKQSALRQAINSPVQSFANDINLMALIQLREEFSHDVLRIVGTVHDAILMMVRDDHVEVVYKRVKEIMAKPKLFEDFGIRLSVPLEADAEVGPWGSGVSLDKWQSQRKPRTGSTRKVTRTTPKRAKSPKRLRKSA